MSDGGGGGGRERPSLGALLFAIIVLTIVVLALARVAHLQ